MNCQNCQAANPPGATVCFQCTAILQTSASIPFYTNPQKDSLVMPEDNRNLKQSINLLLLYLFTEIGISFLYFCLNLWTFYREKFNNSSFGSEISAYYKILSYFNISVMFIIGIICIALMKYKRAQIAMIIIVMLHFTFSLFYLVREHLF
jgi:hypothetical protein